MLTEEITDCRQKNLQTAEYIFVKRIQIIDVLFIFVRSFTEERY